MSLACVAALAVAFPPPPDAAVAAARVAATVAAARQSSVHLWVAAATLVIVCCAAARHFLMRRRGAATKWPCSSCLLEIPDPERSVTRDCHCPKARRDFCSPACEARGAHTAECVARTALRVAAAACVRAAAAGIAACAAAGVHAAMRVPACGCAAPCPPRQAPTPRGTPCSSLGDLVVGVGGGHRGCTRSCRCLEHGGSAALQRRRAWWRRRSRCRCSPEHANARGCRHLRCW